MKRFVYPVLFAAFAIFILLFRLSDYLYETAAMTPFYTTGMFVHDIVSRCGGLLAFASAFLQSCFAIPWIGALCMTALLLLIPYMLKMLFPLANRFESLYWLPSFAILLNYTQLGYMIYVLKTPAVAFMPLLGVVVSLLLVWLFRFIYNFGGLFGKIFSSVWIIAVATLGYYALGCYALFALWLIVPILCRKPSKASAANLSFSVFSGILVVISFFVPYLFYKAGLLHIRVESIYFVGLPDFLWTDAEKILWRPLIFSFVWILLLSASLLFASHEKHAETKISVFAVILFLVCFGGAGYMTYTKTYRDINYEKILKMKRAMDNGEWEKMLDVARSADLSSDDYTPPTRMQVLLTRLALYKLGRDADELFGYPDGDAPYNVLRSHQYLRLMGGRSLYYHYGKLNFSYRWCMEDMVEYGKRPDYLKYMLRCAVMNGETKLARKYADMLRSNPFCKEFVNRYYDSPSEEAKKEYADVAKLLNYETVLDGDGGLIEVYLLYNFATMEGGTREMVNLSLLSCLIQKDINGFWQRFFQLLPTFKDGRIPRHYQEAALLFSQLEQKVDISRLPIDNDVKARFERLIEASANNAQYGDEYNCSVLRSSFGDTYWYYYFFTTELKTN